MVQNNCCGGKGAGKKANIDGVDSPPVRQAAEPTPDQALSAGPVRSPTLVSRTWKRIIGIMVLAAIIPTGVVAWFALDRAGHSIERQAQRTLTAIADGAEAHLLEYLNLLKERTLDFSSDGLIRDMAESHDLSRPAVRDSLNRHLADNKLPLFPECTETFVLNTKGIVVASSMPSRVGNDCAPFVYFKRGLNSIYISDVFRDPNTREIAWFVAAPLKGRSSDAPLGVLVNRIDPSTLSDVTTGQRAYRFGAKTQRLTFGKTGETYIVNRNGLAITKLRNKVSPILSHKVDTKPVRMAQATGSAMTGNYNNYYNKPITGASMYIAGLEWVVLTEMDFNELYGPIKRLKVALLVLLGGILLLVLVVTGRMAANTLRPFEALVAAEERLVRHGEESALVPAHMIPKNEIGDLIRRRNTAIRQMNLARERCGKLIDGVDAIIWEAEVGTWRFTFVSRRAEAILGYPVEQWLNEPGFWVKHLHPLDRSRTVQVYLEASIAGKSLECQYRMVAADGRAVWLHDAAHIVDDVITADGRHVRQLQGLMTNISTAKESEVELRESRNRAQEIIRASRDAIIGINRDGVITIFNPAAAGMFAIPRAEAIGQTPAFLVPDELRSRHETRLQEYLRTGRSSGLVGSTIEIEGRRRDGTAFPIEISLTTTDDPSIRVLAVIGDISERKRTERMLRAIVLGTSRATGHEFFRELVGHLAEGLEVRYALLGESVADPVSDVDRGAGDRIRIIAFSGSDEIAEGMEYDLAGTPCEAVFGGGMRCHRKNVRKLFPDNAVLHELGAESYAGVRLADDKGRSLGVLVVMDTAPMDDPESVTSLLSVFAARAGAELERIRLAAQLGQDNSTAHGAADPRTTVGVEL